MKTVLEWKRDDGCHVCDGVGVVVYKETRATLRSLEMPKEARPGWYAYPKGHELEGDRKGRKFSGPHPKLEVVKNKVAWHARRDLTRMWRGIVPGTQKLSRVQKAARRAKAV